MTISAICITSGSYQIIPRSLIPDKQLSVGMQQVSLKSPAQVRSGRKLRSSNHDSCDRESGNEISTTNDAHFWIIYEERMKSDPVALLAKLWIFRV